MNGELNKYREQVADLENRLKTQGETIAKLLGDNDAATRNNQKEITKREKLIKELQDSEHAERKTYESYLSNLNVE